jgi:nucleotide-binding universal stress UspA family protein
MYRTILVPLDGSRRAEAILAHVEHLAKQNKAKVVFLKVQEEPIMLDRDEVVMMERYHAEFEKRNKEALAYLGNLQTRLNKSDIHSDIRLDYGPVVRAILNAAADTDAGLIAMATHGWGAVARVSYGSVAAGVLQAAQIPILLIRSCDEACDA